MIRNRYNYLTPSVQDTKRERKAHFKQRHHNQDTTSRKLKGQFLSLKIAKWLSKTKKNLLGHTCKRNSKPQQKHRLGTVTKTFTGGRGGDVVGGWGSGTKIDFTWLQPSPLVMPYYTHLFSLREGFLTHEILKQKKTNSWTPVGPTGARAPGTNRLIKSL